MIVIAPTITGNIKKRNDASPIITIITVPPAGGCAILSANISIVETPTAKPKVIKETSKKLIILQTKQIKALIVV